MSDINSLDPLDRAVLSEKGNAQDIVKKLYGKNIGASNAEKQLAGARMHARTKLEQLVPDQSDLEELITKADGTRTTKRMMYLSEEDSKDPLRVMQLMGYDPLQWELVSCKVRRNYWDVSMKLTNSGFDGDGKKIATSEAPHKETNHAFECSVTCKPKQNILSLDTVLNVMEGIKIPTPRKYKYSSNGGLMWEIPYMDLHIGKHAWGDQTGEDNYDVGIAKKRAETSLRGFLARAGNYEKILFPIGQDFFHIDNSDNTTTSGTRVDNTDGRWEKIYTTGVEFLVWAISELRRLAPVDIFYVPGNHDQVLSYCATQTIKYAFQDTDGVTVDTLPAPRKYRRFGKNLIGFSHGKEGKRIESIMQTEVPEMWGKTSVREFHLGDLHHERTWESGGIVFRRIPTISSTDGWHTEKGFKGAVKRAQAFEWDKEAGLINIQQAKV